MVSVSDIEAARETIRGVSRMTPLQLLPRLSDLYGADIFVKREDLQVVRSYMNKHHITYTLLNKGEDLYQFLI